MMGLCWDGEGYFGFGSAWRGLMSRLYNTPVQIAVSMGH